MKNEGALRMRFPRQGGIYRSDVFSLLVNPVQMPPPVGRPRYRAIGRAGRSNTPCPSSAMSSALAIPQRVARQHCPSPLHQQCQIKSFARSAEMLYHRPVHSLLFVCLSQGDKPTRAAAASLSRRSWLILRIASTSPALAQPRWARGHTLPLRNGPRTLPIPPV
jgi:hypothetical protein